MSLTLVGLLALVAAVLAAVFLVPALLKPSSSRPVEPGIPAAPAGPEPAAEAQVTPGEEAVEPEEGGEADDEGAVELPPAFVRLLGGGGVLLLDGHLLEMGAGFLARAGQEFAVGPGPDGAIWRALLRTAPVGPEVNDLGTDRYIALRPAALGGGTARRLDALTTDGFVRSWDLPGEADIETLTDLLDIAGALQLSATLEHDEEARDQAFEEALESVRAFTDACAWTDGGEMFMPEGSGVVVVPPDDPSGLPDAEAMVDAMAPPSTALPGAIGGETTPDAVTRARSGARRAQLGHRLDPGDFRAGRVAGPDAEGDPWRLELIGMDDEYLMWGFADEREAGRALALLESKAVIRPAPEADDEDESERVGPEQFARARRLAEESLAALDEPDEPLEGDAPR